jgi:5'(3')-deoxyribonucleotidase
MAKKVYYFDMDGVLANFHKEPYKYENAISREWIANLDPFMNNIAIVKKLIAEGKSVYINSLAASENAKKGKIDWLAKYLPEIKANHIIIIVGGGKKAEYMKTKTGVLVDDKLSNCKQWAKISGQPFYWVETRGATVEL